ncbi:hypothetical protein AAFF_G00200970 [Aldrovandia affinis]|uniref:Uncharacterized protein n=1 Tax=Aldrovandia affinis TaxID=143900 RepID=A0AAD7RI25_9TELE|nr:hypothetical protein AAFF_G00200970 [Aldrovandia affinis]
MRGVAWITGERCPETVELPLGFSSARAASEFWRSRRQTLRSHHLRARRGGEACGSWIPLSAMRPRAGVGRGSADSRNSELQSAPAVSRGLPASVIYDLVALWLE